TVLRAVLLIWLMFAAPWILLRLTTMWDGYLSDVNAYGVVSAGGNPLGFVAALADGIRSGSAAALDPAAARSDGGVDAAAAMTSKASSVPTTPGDGPGQQAENPASAGGDPAGAGGDPLNDTAGASGPDSPNAQEADGVQAGAANADDAVSKGAGAPPVPDLA